MEVKFISNANEYQIWIHDVILPVEVSLFLSYLNSSLISTLAYPCDENCGYNVLFIYLFFFGLGLFIYKDCRRNFEMGSVNSKLKAHFDSRVIRGQPVSPSKPFIAPNTPNQNFEITIIFSFVERSRNCLVG